MTRIPARAAALAPTDALAIAGIGLFVLGAFLIWWQAAIMLAGAALVGVAVLLAYSRRGRAAEEHHDG